MIRDRLVVGIRDNRLSEQPPSTEGSRVDSRKSCHPYSPEWAGKKTTGLAQK